MVITSKFVLLPAVVFLLFTGSSLSSEEEFWPCEHEVNATLNFNTKEFLGEWLVIADMDDLGDKKDLARCDKVIFHEINRTHLLMSEIKVNQLNFTVVIRNISETGKWDLPDINGGVVVLDLDPGRYLTMAICYRPLRFWWLAVMARSHNTPASPSPSLPSSEQSTTSSNGVPSQSFKEELKGLSGRLWRFGIDLDEASFLTRRDC